jgi:colanic acid/amylovoran biosynthesis protein
MNILLTHISNTLNYGSAMMGINLIRYLTDNVNLNVNIYTDIDEEYHLERLKKSCKYNNIFMDDIQGKYFKKRANKIIKGIRYFTNISKYVNELKLNYDCVIVLGGDDLSESYGKISPILEMYKLSKIAKQIPVFLIGQTIGPFTSYRENLAKYFLKECNIYTRDPWTYNYLHENLALYKLKNGADLAILDLPNQDNGNEEKLILEKYNLKADSYITLVPSGLVKSYTNNEDNYVNNWVKIVNDILENKNLSDKKIVLLSHVLKPDYVDDRNIIYQILKKLNNEIKHKIVFIDSELLPHEARFILGNGIFTITGRMHAAISTFQMNKPAISLAYSIKYKGVIGSQLGFDKLIVDSSDYRLWENYYICNEVDGKINYVLNNYNTIKQNIDISIEQSKKIVMDEIVDICFKIGGKYGV